MYTEEELKAPHFYDKIKFSETTLLVFTNWTNIADIERRKFENRHGKKPTKKQLNDRIKYIHTNLRTLDWDAELLDDLKYFVPGVEVER